MIHVFIGTKAQYIKTAPILHRLDAEGIPYNLIDSGQHAGLSRALRDELRVRRPDTFLREGEDISSIAGLVTWMARALSYAMFRSADMRKKLFGNRGGVCLVHGDTPTTLLSVVFAKRTGLHVAHLEAGLRSFNYLNPFPEELIRVIVMHMADILFAPSAWAVANLEKMKVRGKKVSLKANTNVHSLAFSLGQGPSAPLAFENYCLTAIHRVENLHHRFRMKRIIRIIIDIASQRQVVFVLHPPTEARLKKLGLYASLANNERIMLFPLVSHRDFIQLLKHSDFVVTDGGSIQEECAHLNKPCLLMRKNTERRDGLGTNVCLSGFRSDVVAHFMNHWREFLSPRECLSVSPVDEILDHLRPYA